MLIKTIFVFLLVMAGIGMIGKALFPGKVGRILQSRRKTLRREVCSRCGRHVIGTSGCDCGKA